MLINLTYVFILFVGIYFGIVTYIAIKKREIFLILGIFVFSLILECSRLNNADYKLLMNDVFWTSRDILWTLVMIYFFQFMKNNFACQNTLVSVKKELKGKKAKKK